MKTGPERHAKSDSELSVRQAKWRQVRTVLRPSTYVSVFA